MLFQVQVCAAASSLLLLLLSLSGASAAPNGYNYDPPSPLARAPPINTGHYFTPLSTVAPLPPVPALPPLPTARSTSQLLTQGLLQVHPAPARPTPRSLQPTAPPPPSRNIAAAYRPPSFDLRRGFPNGAPGAPTPETQLFLLGGTTPPPPLIGLRYRPPSAPSGPSAPGQPAPIVPASRAQAAAQPLRIPFGQRPVISFPQTAPDNDVYVINGRQLKQYAVIEFTDDNDISQDTKPFLTQSHVDSYRAQVGASGTGAIAQLPSAMQLEPRSSALVQEQQRLAVQGRFGAGSETIALGSGGLGFIRLPNGSVSLGSGSLGFITGQQHSEEVRDARTRSGAPAPDALHFGHGSLGAPNFRYRFK